MLYSNSQILNFFQKPDEIVQYAKSLDYYKDPKGKWPGERSKCLSEINYNFFNITCRKILSSVFPMDFYDISFKAHIHFQVIHPEQSGSPGWIHQDIYSDFSSIIYLSHHENCGTNFFTAKNELLKFSGEEGRCPSDTYNKIKEDYYVNNKPFDKKYFQALEKNNSNFVKTGGFNSIYNSLITFDGHTDHNANLDQHFNSNGPRITLISFFTNIISKGRTLKYPGSELDLI